MTIRWTNYEDIRSPDVFTALHTGLTVGLIATPRDDLMTCRINESVSNVMERNTEPYDFLPVTKDDDTETDAIVGLFRAEEFFDSPDVKDSVGRHIIPLTEGYVIGADASILEFIVDADSRPCRLVVSGSKIAGLVSLSDLQKLPVRAALFGLVTGFEMTMMTAIERHIGDEQVWLELLSFDRREKIDEEIAKSRHEDGFVNALLFTQWCDKKTIITKSLGLPYSKKQLQSQLDDLESLRNNLAHANEYAVTPEQARAVCDTVRNLLRLHHEISGLGVVERGESGPSEPGQRMEAKA